MGWGIQTWTIAAMMAKGAIPKADLAIHADTTHERSETYSFAAKWTEWLKEHGLPVVTVRPRSAHVFRKMGEAGSVVTRNGGRAQEASADKQARLLDAERVVRSGIGRIRTETEYEVKIPVFTANRDGSLGQLSRQCTADWKINPINREVRSLLPKDETAVMQLGISKDEFLRAKDAKVDYVRNEFPLLYDKPMSRQDCVTWLEDEKLPLAPKSACVFCPFHKTAAWERMRREGGRDWQKAVALDEAIRDKRPAAVYLWDARRPLAELRTAEDFGLTQPPLFDDFGDGGCDEGVCWV